MVYATLPPYQVLQTALIDAASVQRFARLARYWDLLANSGRFVRTLALLLENRRWPTGVRSSRDPGCCLAVLAFHGACLRSGWLWHRLGSTRRLDAGATAGCPV
jgi:hypothetical protein